MSGESRHKMSMAKIGKPSHHIDYNKKNNVLKNLVTLCFNCHSMTNSHRESWLRFFMEVEA